MSALAMEAPSNSSDPIARPLRPVRAAVIGLGRSGIAHAAVLSTIPDCEVVGFADARPAARRNLRGLGYAMPAFPALRKLLDATSPAAAFVCLPDRERAAAVRLALESGVAVMTDRPILDSAEVAVLAHLAAEKGVAFAYAHPLAYHPVFAHARRILNAGTLGATRQVRSSMYVSRIFSSTQQRAIAQGSVGGVVSQFACDLLFLLIWYVGMPVSVRAQWSRLYGDLEDELHGMLTLANGIEAGFDSSWSVPGYPSPATVIELEGENGKLLASDDALEFELDEACAGHPAGPSRIGHAALPHLARFDLDGESLYLQDSSFLAWVTGGAPSPNDAAMALTVSRVMEALYLSAREGGRTVELGS